MAPKIKKSRMDPARIDAVLSALPANEVQRIRHALKNAPPPKPKRAGRPITLLTGQKFGSWNVGPRTDKPGVKYLCLCDCGNTGIVDARLLRRGLSTKCKQCASKHVGKNLPRVAAKLQGG